MDYDQIINRYSEITKDAASARSDWSKGLILLASTLFGILVSLFGTIPHEPGTAFLLALSITLLGGGILTLGISAYEYVYLRNQHVKALGKKLQAAHQMRPVCPTTYISSPRIFSRCRIISYIAFAMSVMLLCVYSLLSSL